MASIAKLLEKGRIETKYSEKNEPIFTDASVQYGGYGEYVTPVDILATSLAHCALTTMAIRAQHEGIAFDGAWAEVGEIAEDPKTITVTSIEITFHLPATVDEKLRSKFESFAHKGCYVGNSLNIEKKFTFVYE
ncbi:OsmC family protein [Prevotella ihumii]|uniref:OsmC family protein n=1 Tax=Prevotella ihumii TaxID=1917878 RepID=UPI000981A590|nr:OsmC family protein [Prevotella ihumii]